MFRLLQEFLFLKQKDKEALIKNNTFKIIIMKKILLTVFLLNMSFGYAQNLIFNGNMEAFNSPTSTPNGWSSSSDFGGFNQNTTDFTEGLSSVEFTAEFSDLSMFTTVDIPLESGKTYIIRYDYKYLGTSFDANDNIEFSFFSTTAPFVDGTNIENNDWNTVETQYTPAETRSDFEATLRVIPAGFGGNYKVLFDNIEVFENAPLSKTTFDINKKIFIITQNNKQFKITKTTDVTITKITLYSIIGKEKQMDLNTNTTLNLSTFASGIYILKIATTKGNIVKKIAVN
jgi:hypothetical protein